MIPSWPESLPQALLVEGYNQSFPDITIKSDMDAGPAKVRRRFTAGVEPVSGMMFLAEEQLEYLRTFYKDTLLGGSLRFSWMRPPEHVDACEMRFTAPPTWTRVEGEYKVSLALEILP